MTEKNVESVESVGETPSVVVNGYTIEFSDGSDIIFDPMDIITIEKLGEDELGGLEMNEPHRVTLISGQSILVDGENAHQLKIRRRWVAENEVEVEKTEEND